jgi:hypothetical protein
LIKYPVYLTPDEIDKFQEDLRHCGTELNHKLILLATRDDSEHKLENATMTGLFGYSSATLAEVRKNCFHHGVDVAIKRKKRGDATYISKITGEFEARLLSLACGPCPKQQARWTLKSLAEACVKLKYIDSISTKTVWEILNTNEVKPHLSDYWCIPARNDPEFAQRMEEVLYVYHLPYDEKCPVICMDEKPLQLLRDVRERIMATPMSTDPDTGLTKPGHNEIRDDEYERMGTASIFIFTEPLTGWCKVVAEDTHKKVVYANLLREVQQEFSKCSHVRIVSDNLATHGPGGFYEAFQKDPDTAEKLHRFFLFTQTPTHGSWLNMAECELSRMSRECLLKRRIATLEELNDILRLWQEERRKNLKGINWHFDLNGARKLYRLYPERVMIDDDLSRLLGV